MDLIAELDRCEREALAAFAAATDAAALEHARVAFLGRQGRLKALTTAFRDVPPDQKRSIGPALSRVTASLDGALAERGKTLAAATSNVATLDLTLPVPRQRPGSVHPLSQISAEVERVFQSMGYAVVDGPHVELDEHNFSRLNIPADHPARDSHDTFWLSTGALLRTHTTAVESRTVAAEQPPLRRVVVGKVFRYEATDATHENTFHQVEGFCVDEGISAAHLVGTLRTMLRALLRRDDVDIRLRPSFFPFVEPGFEVDVRLTKADSDSRLSRWIELLGCGMLHPKVLCPDPAAPGAWDTKRWRGFAFGMGLERLALIRHGIADIRVFHGADLRSLRQFGPGYW